MVIIQDTETQQVLMCLGETRFMRDNTSTIVTQPPPLLNYTANQINYVAPVDPMIHQLSMELLTLDVRTLQARCDTQQALLDSNARMIVALEEHNRLQNESIDALRKELLEHRNVLEKQHEMIHELRDTIDQQQQALATQTDFSRLIASHVVDELLAIRIRNTH